MKINSLFSVFMSLFFLVLTTQAQNAYKYKDSKLSVEERTSDLISHMTIEEKVGQLLCPLGWEMYQKKGEEIVYSTKFEKIVQKRHIGMLWGVYRADPWTKKTIENGLNPKMAAETGNALQRYVIEHTRLGIPLFLAEECPHGHMAIGTTVFPTGIGLAASWSPVLLEKVCNVISKELRLQGGHIAYGPVLDLVRDPRWGRVEETFGEDPVLSAALASGIIKGEGGGDLTKPNSALTTLKHFIAYGVPEAGQNGNPSHVGPHELQDTFLPPFRSAINAGALSVMTSYNSIDGTPNTSNSYLLTDLLRNEWKFKGFVVSDLYSIEGLKTSHYVAPTMKDAAVMAAEAGLDVDLGGDAFVHLITAVQQGRISESVIDTTVSRVLRLKLEMGLFENPYVDPELAKNIVRRKEHIDIARQAAQQAIVLLKNNGVLPLSRDRKIAVIGPNADNRYNMLGDYTAPQEDSNVKTILDGIRSKVKASQIEYVRGCAIRDTLHTDIDKAVAAAQRTDVAIVVVGGSSARDFKTKYIATGAATVSEENISDMESGEGYDRATLDLLGKQIDLLKAVKATGKPVIVVYIQGRPLNMNWSSENADALLTAWYPGQEGGNAIADVLWGDYNPAGRLPVSVPRSVGQIPVYYNKANPKGHNYLEVASTPLYSFGYGLSYSKFEYRNLEVTKKEKYKFDVSFTVKNSGSYDGDEVAQLYLRDEFASTVQPIRQLKHFEKFFLKKGEERRVTFSITEDDLSIVNQKLEKIVEDGAFAVMVGASSDDIRLKSVILVD